MEIQEIEIWLPVVGYEDYYEVSNMGRIRSLRRTIYTKDRKTKNKPSVILDPKPNPYGYKIVSIRVNNIRKCIMVHRLVAMAFIKNEHSKPFVNHKDRNRSNNHVENLEWCTQSENVLHGWLTRPKDEVQKQKKKIAERASKIKGDKHPQSNPLINTTNGRVYANIREAAEDLGIKMQNLYYMINRKGGNVTFLVYV
jgi:hypothetical protein